ncbi:MAG TPA: hypothetical protein VF862_01530 [Gemmatimonadales bacterium]
MPTPSLLTRRAVLARLGAVAAAVAAGCTPVRYALRLYPPAFDDDRDVRDQTLRAFVLAAVPSADPGDPHLTRAFDDRLFPFVRYRNFFAADLCGRADRLFGESRFDRLDRREQAKVIANGLAADGVTRRLYAGAVFLAQVSVLGGIYAPDGAVPPLGFEGTYQFRGLDAITYPDPGRFLAAARTTNGNPP